MNPAKVNVSTAFETIIDISESSHTLEIKFKIQLEWYEYRTKERVIQIVSFWQLSINPISDGGIQYPP